MIKQLGSLHSTGYKAEFAGRRKQLWVVKYGKTGFSHWLVTAHLKLGSPWLECSRSLHRLRKWGWSRRQKVEVNVLAAREEIQRILRPRSGNVRNTVLGDCTNPTHNISLYLQ